MNEKCQLKYNFLRYTHNYIMYINYLCSYLSIGENGENFWGQDK